MKFCAFCGEDLIYNPKGRCKECAKSFFKFSKTNIAILAAGLLLLLFLLLYFFDDYFFMIGFLALFFLPLLALNIVPGIFIRGKPKIAWYIVVSVLLLWFVVSMPFVWIEVRIVVYVTFTLLCAYISIPIMYVQRAKKPVNYGVVWLLIGPLVFTAILMLIGAVITTQFLSNLIGFI